jgi:anti-sigma factor RsiW
MQCAKVREKFVDYVDEDVRFTERICVEVHVARCYACREELDELISLRNLCRSAVSHPGIENGITALKKRIAEREAVVRSVGVWGSENWRNTVTKLAAAAVVLFILGVSTPLVRHSRWISTKSSVNAASESETREVLSVTVPFVMRKQALEDAASLDEVIARSDVGLPEDARHTPPG